MNKFIPWASYQIRKIAGCTCAGNAGNVSPRIRIQRKPRVSDPGMHHGTCVTHVPWCMSGLLTCDGGENVPGIPGACAPAIWRIWQEAHVRKMGTGRNCWWYVTGCGTILILLQLTGTWILRFSINYTDVTRASWCLKSPATRLDFQEKSKDPHCWSFMTWIHRWSADSFTKRQLYKERFRVMTSSEVNKSAGTWSSNRPP